MGTKIFLSAFTAFQFITLFSASAQDSDHSEYTFDVISSNNEIKTLTLGCDKKATDGIDSSFGEIPLPAYVPNQFDARFRLPDSTTTVYKDLRFGCWVNTQAFHTLEWVNSQSITIMHRYQQNRVYGLIFSDYDTGIEFAFYHGTDSIYFQPPAYVKKIRITVAYGAILSPPYYHFVFPQGGEVFQAGSIIDIKFDSFLSYPTAKNDLFFSSDNGASWEYIGATPTQFDSIYSWTVPSINSNKCKIRVGDYPCVYGENPGIFSISTTVPVEMDLIAEKSFNLAQNYPNPFNPITTINYSVPELGLVNITVFDVLGRKVKTLVITERPAGDYSVPFDASKLSGGIYYYRMTTNRSALTRKMILLK